MLKGDAERIRQIVNNVLFNALKFTSEGKIKFEIKCLIEGEVIKLNFIITDTGVGISNEKMQSIFDSFSQETINNKRKYGGLGLGLYIVKALVNLHKGDISLTNNELQSGTVCNLNLNVQKADFIESSVNVIENNFDLMGKNILVVEDNAMNQMVIKMITKKWLNTTIDYVNNVQECLDKISLSKYDVILMDLQMPIMDGYEATIEIRKGKSGINPKDIPIIAITADLMETTKIRVKEIGMNHYLSKPVSNEDLFHSIQECVI
ncbi:MAG: response regulator [Flavobacterium sp.]|nr:response regulator [Flavobacterium sp.]